MSGLKSSIRKIIPLRASVFESFRKHLDRQLAPLDSLDSIEKLIKEVNDRAGASQARSDADLTNIRESLQKTNALLSEIRDKVAQAEKRIDELEKTLHSEIATRGTSIEWRISRFENNWRSREFGYDYERTRLPEERPTELRRWFKDQTGNDLDLQHPQTFNEKIQWLKLYDPVSNSTKAKLADKIACREIVSDIVGDGHMVNLLAVWDSPNDIEFESLPNSFVIKANHGSGWTIIVENKDAANLDSVRQQASGWLKRQFPYVYGFEMHYELIPPLIFAEEYLPHDEKMFEIQIWCFNGSPEFLSLIREPHGENKKATFSPNWDRLPFVTSPPTMDETPPAPKCLDELLDNAKKLSGGFTFARIDYYLLNDDNWKFSEITFTPASGVVKWNPEEYNTIMGDKLILP